MVNVEKLPRIIETNFNHLRLFGWVEEGEVIDVVLLRPQKSYPMELPLILHTMFLKIYLPN